ncbi:MAG: permease-like cell division protein FtsX [Bdellovibrionales bacterium]|nr:permease-like cell division protein FtsX [Bdellovibrionales bacterium]
MNQLMSQHLFRAWRKHWALQVASVTIMTMVLMMLNFLFLGYSAFNGTIEHWGRGLEMTVYLKDGAPDWALEKLEKSMRTSREFDEVHFTGKSEATKKFLTALGPESLDLLADPKWKSPIPASLDAKLSDKVATSSRVQVMEGWSAKLKANEYVEDVFYGQGWVENFASFLGGARGLVVLFWALSLSVGLMIVSNCIRLSFLQRRDEIEVLELVGATSRFIRMPYIFEGVVLGLVASLCSLALSYGMHALLLNWLAGKWSFWVALQALSPLEPWSVMVNLVSGVAFGALGAWNCVRRINTGWSAAAG